MERRPEGDGGSRLGEYALAASLAAVACAFVPAVGDVVVVPLAVLAIVLALVEIRRHESGRKARVGQATVGAVLAAVMLLVVFMTFAASQLHA